MNALSWSSFYRTYEGLKLFPPTWLVLIHIIRFYRTYEGLKPPYIRSGTRLFLVFIVPMRD